jgi:type II secretory pathway pseudopilin PulG
MSRTDRRVSGFDDRSISDLIAFILMFSIIITGVGIVSLGAFGNLTEFSDREKVENSERGLTAMASTLDEFQRQSDTYRPEIKLAIGGSSAYLNQTNLTVTVDDVTKTEYEYFLNSTEQRFDRRPEDVVVSYEGGGVFRRPGFGARYQPSMKCRSNTAIISFVTLVADNFDISSGYEQAETLNPRGLPGESPVADLDSTLLFSARLDTQNTNTTYVEGSDIDVTLDLSDTANPKQWGEHFENSPGEWDTISGQWGCESVDAVLIRQTVVELFL